MALLISATVTPAAIAAWFVVRLSNMASIGPPPQIVIIPSGENDYTLRAGAPRVKPTYVYRTAKVVTRRDLTDTSSMRRRGTSRPGHHFPSRRFSFPCLALASPTLLRF